MNTVHSSQNDQIDTAVIPLAGLGTRMAPLTSGIPKFMTAIYVGDQARPSIDFSLDELLGAGIRNLVFVTSNGGDAVLRDYLDPMSSDVIERYRSLGKHDDLGREQTRRKKFADLNIVYLDQPLGSYGTAVPLGLAREVLSGVKRFALSGGDDFIWNPDGTSELRLQLEALISRPADYGIMGRSAARSEAPNYGIITMDAQGMLQEIIEKPSFNNVPEKPLANISRYILGQGIWSHLDHVLSQPTDQAQPEYRITDVINHAADAGKRFDVHAVRGIYLDAGSPEGALKASLMMSGKA